MKPRKKIVKPEPKDRFADWAVTGIALALIALIIYVDQYGR